MPVKLPENCHPRGFYRDASSLKWTKDTTVDYFEGIWNQIHWPCIKITICLLICQLSPSRYWSIANLVILIMSYQYVIAKLFPNTIVIPAMDYGCFLSNPNAIANAMGVLMFDKPTDDLMYHKYRDAIVKFPKLRYKIKEIAGDYYYEEMSVEETIEKAFVYPDSQDKILKSQKDIDQYIQDNLNFKLPLDGPQCRVYCQKYEPEDQMELPESERPKSIMIIKLHHSVTDGVSFISLTLAQSDHYSKDYFVRSKEIGIWSQIALSLTWFVYIPKICMNTFFARNDRNYFTEKKSGKEISGEINICSTSVPLDLSRIKKVCKYLNVTINDFVLCAYLTSLKMIFKEQKDFSKDVQIALPANIRFQLYPDRESVRLENKFSAMSMTVPLTESMQNSYGEIKKVTNHLRQSLGQIYGVYSMIFWSTIFIPRFVSMLVLDRVSQKYSIGFTNVAGSVKPMEFTHPKSGELITMTSSQSYGLFAGRIGVVLCALSMNDKIRLAMVNDELVCNQDETQKIVQTIHELMLAEIKRVENLEFNDMIKKDQ